MSMCISCVHTYTYYQYTCTLPIQRVEPSFFVLLMALKFRIHVPGGCMFFKVKIYWERHCNINVAMSQISRTSWLKHHKPGIWNFTAPYFERLPFTGITRSSRFQGVHQTCHQKNVPCKTLLVQSRFHSSPKKFPWNKSSLNTIST